MVRLFQLLLQLLGLCKYNYGLRGNSTTLSKWKINYGLSGKLSTVCGLSGKTTTMFYSLCGKATTFKGLSGKATTIFYWQGKTKTTIYGEMGLTYKSYIQFWQSHSQNQSLLL